MQGKDQKFSWMNHRFWFVTLHTILIIGWGVINVAYYPILQNHGLYFWLLPSAFAAAFFSRRVYLITLLQECVLSTVVVWQTPSTFHTSMHTVLFVNGVLLIVFECLFRFRNKLRQLEQQYQREISIYRNSLTQAKFVPYERDYVANTFSFLGDTVNELTGFSKETLTPDFWDMNSDVIKVLGEGQGMTAQRAVEEARHGAISHWVAECSFKLNENQHRFFLNSAIEVKDNKGQSIRSIGFLQDITEQKLSEHLTFSENAVLEQIITNQPLKQIAETLVLKFEEVFPYSMCSLLTYQDSTKTLHNLASPSLLKDYVDRIDGLDISSYQGSCGRAIQTKSYVIVTDTYTDPIWEGYSDFMKRFRLKTCWSFPILSAQNKVLGTFAVYFHSSREPMTVEIEYIQRWANIITLAFEASKRDQNLRENEEWFRTMIEHSSDAVFVYNKDGYIQYASPFSLNLTGFETHELLGKHHHELIHPEDVEKAERAFLQMKETYTIKPQTEQMRIQHKSGYWISIEIMGRNLLHIPTVNGMVVNVRDVTDRRLAEDALRRQEEQLWRSQNLESLGRLTKGISHEFNNLLTKIYGNCEIIKFQPNLPDTVRERIALIYDSTKQASALTQQLKMFSRQQSDVSETIELNQLIQENQEILKHILSNRISLQLKLADKPVFILAGRNHIQQILINLATNARDAMSGEGTFSIQTEIETDMEHSRFSNAPTAKVILSDTGSGMDEAVKQNMFEPFYTTKDPGKNRGLGLATVYWIVEQYKGQIECVSSPGEGATFVITFPAMPSEAPENFVH